MSAGPGSIHSDLWHRVADLKLRLKPETTIDRQVVRGEVWYVASDRFSTRSYRISPAVWAVLMRMDGRRTLERIWREAVEQFGEEAPAQDQILGVVSQLYAAELIGSDRPVDGGEIAERAEKHTKGLTSQRYRNPMFLRFPLVDPDRALAATAHLVRPFCGPLGAALWLGLVGWFVVAAAMHWTELSSDVADRVLVADSILIFLVVFPALKLLHELGHAYAVKLLGGPVHEMGISFLTFMPAPYVDASASALFPSRWQRALVGAAGMLVELAVAAVALIVWLQAEPGLVRSIAYDVVFIASVSTIVFNTNPLLRFDGYYILTDLLGLPNLAIRSQRLYLALAQRDLFGLRHVVLPHVAAGERFWLITYAPASLTYRMIVVVGIALFIGTQYFFFGVALVVWMLATTILWPLLKGLHYVLMSPALAGHRLRALTITVGTLAILIGAVTLVRIPHGTVTQGVVWIPEDTHVVTEVPGHVMRFLAEPGSRVSTGAALVELDDPYIASKRAAAEARLEELQARLIAAEPTSPYETQIIRNQVAYASDDLDETKRRQRALVVRAPRDGTFLVPKQNDLLGSFARRGELVGYVMSVATPVVRAAVPEEDIDLVRTEMRGIAVRLESSMLAQFSDARVTRQFPAATRQLPSRALAAVNGGPFALDPADKNQNTTLLSFFAVDVEVASDLLRDHWGERAWIRFDHGASPLVGRWWRTARQVFLGHFRV